MRNFLFPRSLVALCGLVASCGQPPAPDAPVAEEQVRTSEPANPDALATGEAESAASTLPGNFRALGTEPFWAIHVTDDRLRYMTPEDQEGQSVPFVREQTVRDELTLSATLNDLPLVVTLRAGTCSDGMSDRIYPYAVTLRFGDESRQGCGRPTDG